MADAPINITRTFLPPLEEFVRQLESVWDRQWVTNDGQLAKELERRLREVMGAAALTLVNSGTSALEVALTGLGVEGDVITTPFSHVATTGALLWKKLNPVFVDIDPRTLCLDPARIEASLTPNTTAILATHVYGCPCDVAAIESIARKHRLKVIYDGAHAFGVRYQGQSIFTYGDATAVSFHATKLFHTVEGGAVATGDERLAKKLGLMRAFGHYGDDHIVPGSNARMSELHAAMGLCLLPRVDEFIAARGAACRLYDSLLASTPLQKPGLPENCERNYCYYPVIFPTEERLLAVKGALEAKQIYPRRYFYPSLNRLPYVDGESCPISEDVSPRIMCLPLHATLAPADVERIAAIVRKNL
jgi:dTDP-4-amino-4,6-dideoxygalactose transaminase